MKLHIVYLLVTDTFQSCKRQIAKFSALAKLTQARYGTNSQPATCENGKGSWPAIGTRYGRLDATAINLMCLGVYCRHLPLHGELFSRDSSD